MIRLIKVSDRASAIETNYFYHPSITLLLNDYFPTTIPSCAVKVTAPRAPATEILRRNKTFLLCMYFYITLHCIGYSPSIPLSRH